MIILIINLQDMIIAMTLLGTTMELHLVMEEKQAMGAMVPLSVLSPGI